MRCHRDVPCIAVGCGPCYQRDACCCHNGTEMPSWATSALTCLHCESVHGELLRGCRALVLGRSCQGFVMSHQVIVGLCGGYTMHPDADRAASRVAEIRITGTRIMDKGCKGKRCGCKRCGCKRCGGKCCGGKCCGGKCCGGKGCSAHPCELGEHLMVNLGLGRGWSGSVVRGSDEIFLEAESMAGARHSQTQSCQKWMIGMFV